MPRLSDLTDYDPMGNYTGGILPAEPIIGVNNNADLNLPVKFSDDPKLVNSTPASNNVDKILNSLFRDDEKRYQLWPEKLVRSGTTAAGRAMTGELPQWAIDPATGDVHTSPQMIEAAQEMSALAGTGGLGGTGGTLNATPSLRPALKHDGKLYKGKPGQEHMDVIPADLYPTFQKQAMSGEDISNFNFGFINDKGHFLNREDALKYGIDNGLIDPQAGKYGALTSTLFADSSKPGAAIEAMKTANPFFSALEHNVKQISQSKMTGDQWLGTLGNKPGVKPEELQWTGLADFLNENKGKPVTKAQIEEHLAANKVELKEVQKGELSDKQIMEQSKIRPEDWDKMSQSQKELIRTNFPTEKTKYHSYQLPGGENYREMLMTLPNKPTAKISFDDWYKQTNIQDFDKLSPKAQELVKAKYEKEGQKVLNPDVYRSSHWDEPNILAHVRMNDRTIDGKKSLHLEEIQSDWHQQGREKGYVGKESPAELVKQEKAAVEKAWLKESDGKYKSYSDAMAANVSGPEFLALQKKVGQNPELSTIREKLNQSRDGVPDAPFKKSWHELALKRMLREASEKGYDRLSWTPGEAQAARYDLSTQVKNLEVRRNDNGTYDIKGAGARPGGGTAIDGIPANKLSDHVGKEMADKISKQEGSYKKYEGLDLKIGGEGMKGFYDQIIPKALEKLGKEHGVKVKSHAPNKNYTIEEITVDGGRKLYDVKEDGKLFSSFHTKKEAEKVVADNKHKTGQQLFYIDIPQSLKDTATQKGFPLFSAGGYMLMPVVGNPFEDKK